MRSIRMKRHLPETAEVHKTGPVQLRCLIVDDDEEFLKLAHAPLKRDGVTGAGVAHNSAEAVQRTRPCGRTADLRDRLSPAEVFSEVLEHRWYMSEAAARDVGTTAATRHYIEQVLSAVPARLDETISA